MSSAGHWDPWYVGEQWDPTHPGVYGEVLTYQLGGLFLDAYCPQIEDWGCGKGGFTMFVKDPNKVRGLDGSKTPWVHEVVDLATYRSNVPGIFMRHVLEHNYAWEQILDNALDSFTVRMVLVLFTPMLTITPTREIAHTADIDVPDLSFRLNDLRSHWAPRGITEKLLATISTDTEYGSETLIGLER